MNQAETRTITATTGTVLTLDKALTFMHFGVLQTFKGGSRTLDERAEVGLLTRNILVQGDEVRRRATICCCCFVVSPTETSAARRRPLRSATAVTSS